MMELINVLFEVFGSPVVSAILMIVISGGYWILNNRIELLKDHISLQKAQIDELNKYSEDILVQRLVARHKAISDELSEMDLEQKTNLELISGLENEKEQISKKLENIAVEILKAHKICGFNCLYCNMPNKGVKNIGFIIEHDGITYAADIEAICHHCGRKTVDISEIQQIRSK